MKSLDERSHQWSGKYIEHGVQPRSGLQNHVLFSQMKGVLHELNDQRVISISRANMERECVCMRPKEHDTWSKGWKALDDGGCGWQILLSIHT